MSRTVLLRVRFSAAMVARLDVTTRNISVRLERRIPRSAVIRAIIQLLGDRLAVEDVPGLEGLLSLNSVKRGRGRAPRSGGAT